MNTYLVPALYALVAIAVFAALVVVIVPARGGRWDPPPPPPSARPGTNPLPPAFGERPAPPPPPPPRRVSGWPPPDAFRDQQARLIAYQQLQIESLKARCLLHEDDKRQIHSSIYCIGGPLNDNKLKYSREQMTIFWRIAELCDMRQVPQSDDADA